MYEDKPFANIKINHNNEKEIELPNFSKAKDGEYVRIKRRRLL